MKIWVNGIITNKISANDRGFQFGDGLFETLKIIDFSPQDLELHLSRMADSASKLKIKFPDFWVNEINLICQDIQSGVLKLILTRGESGSGLHINPNATPTRIIKISELPRTIHQFQQSGVALSICSEPMIYPTAIRGIKSLSWQVLALANLQIPDGYQEALLLDNQGNIVEGTTSNFFAIKDNQLLTPDLSNGGLKGIMREKIINIATTIGLKISKTALKPTDNFEACFITNSIIGLYPVVKILAKNYQINKTVKILQNYLLDYN